MNIYDKVKLRQRKLSKRTSEKSHKSPYKLGPTIQSSEQSREIPTKLKPTKYAKTESSKKLSNIFYKDEVEEIIKNIVAKHPQNTEIAK